MTQVRGLRSQLVMYTMRNRVSYGYDKVDLEIVWKAIQGDLPVLYRHVQTIADGALDNWI